MKNETIKKKVLIADDESTVRRLVRQTLNADYTVLEAQNGEEAVNTARAQMPDIILMDIVMPEIDGITACTILKRGVTTANIVVVMLTVLGYELNRKLAEDAALADGYITKPFGPKELLGVVGRFMDLKTHASNNDASQLHYDGERCN